MNGNKRLYGKTVRQEAIAQVSARLSSWGNVDDAVVATTDGARPGTIGGVVRDYIDSLGDAAYKRFCAECRR